ncbi:hypothetical protein B0T14DRAFT_565945 [Immersiella caudata]|uniref:Uncharacterized protein n=1 Tax=Immersiella caudata TaxID=314043 RepID=A0AA39WP89_9PEZI|nr:hypothetical protein B0T14DRAFT_565945 [Immersiella caudata]
MASTEEKEKKNDKNDITLPSVLKHIKDVLTGAVFEGYKSHFPGIKDPVLHMLNWRIGVLKDDYYYNWEFRPLVPALLSKHQGLSEIPSPREQQDLSQGRVSVANGGVEWKPTFVTVVVPLIPIQTSAKCSCRKIDAGSVFQQPYHGVHTMASIWDIVEPAVSMVGACIPALLILVRDMGSTGRRYHTTEDAPQPPDPNLGGLEGRWACRYLFTWLYKWVRGG